MRHVKKATTVPAGQGENKAVDAPPGVDAQLVELVESVWACERAWTTEARLDAVIRYGSA